MAARRLAISSLLCEDDSQPISSTPIAGPSRSPRPPSPQNESTSTPFQNTYQSQTIAYPDAYSRRGHSPPPIGRDSLPPVSQLQTLSLRSSQSYPYPIPPASSDYAPSRREYQYVPFDGNDYASAASGSVATRSYAPLQVDYDRFRRQTLQSDLPQQQQSSFHSPESYTYQHHSTPVDPSLSLARPTSSRSGHSGSPSSFSLHHHHHSQSPHPALSPTHSPLLPYASQSRPSQSPNLPLHRLSASPHTLYPNTYSPRHSQTPYTFPPIRNHSPPGQHSPPSSYFPEVSPQHSTPHLPHHSPSLARPTLAALLTSPLVPRSAASLPNILNGTSPISRNTASDFGPLEALVQAASQERRRLSGEVQRPAASELNTPKSTMKEQEATLEQIDDSSEQHPYQPYSQQTSYEDRREFVVTSPSVSASRLLSDGHPLPSEHFVHTGEPPAKRRRSSGESMRPLSVTTVPPETPDIPLPSPVLPAPSEGSQPKSPIKKPEDLTIGPGTTPVPHQEMAVETPIQAEIVLRPDPREVPMEGKVEMTVERTGREEKPKKERKPAKTSGKLKGKDHPQITAEPAKQRLPEQESQEQDPHEWLLEHYSSPRPVASTVPPPADKPVASEVIREPAQAAESGREKKGEGKAASRGGKHKAKKPVMGAQPAVIPSPVPSNDIDLELELATATAPSHPEAKPEDPTDMDVDDELLSLLDDKPQPSHTPHPPPATSAPSHSEHLKPSSASRAAPTSHPAPTRSPSVTPVNLKIERESMPPPTVSTPTMEDTRPSPRPIEVPPNAVASSSKKKEPAKAPPKHKAATKPRAKAAPKGKTKAAKDTSATPTPNTVLSAAAVALTVATKGKKGSPFPGSGQTSNKRGGSAAVSAPSRSRSTSVMPPPSEAEKAGQEEGADTKMEDVVDDKLYCVCKTGYDEDRVMIACDRCDEWYHTQCVHMPDLEVDLVDQFICPVCVEKHPTLSLKTTYKKRCLNGLKHPHPDSAQACHKPARGVFSKYCSDECGVMYMQLRMKVWTGDKALLWESVKHAEKREAVVIRCVSTEASATLVNGNHSSRATPSDTIQEIVRPTKTKSQKEAQRLQALLDKVAGRRDEIKKDLEVVLWREKLLELATERAASVEQCGWDQRLCFGDEDYAEYGPGVLETYEDEVGKTDDGMQVDGAEETWWCVGKKKCDRHAGWQKLRFAEVSFEKETMENLLAKLTAEERDLRKRLEDAADSQSKTSPLQTFTPLQPLNARALANGNSIPKVNGDSGGKKGKKRKQEAH